MLIDKLYNMIDSAITQSLTVFAYVSERKESETLKSWYWQISLIDLEVVIYQSNQYSD